MTKGQNTSSLRMTSSAEVDDTHPIAMSPPYSSVNLVLQRS
jgi:hypothetical protein